MNKFLGPIAVEGVPKMFCSASFLCSSKLDPCLLLELVTPLDDEELLPLELLLLLEEEQLELELFEELLLEPLDEVDMGPSTSLRDRSVFLRIAPYVCLS